MAILLAVLANPGPPGAERMDLSVLTQGFHSSAQAETLLVCRTQAELDSAVSGLGIRLPDTLRVDFSGDMVLVAAAGERPTAGFGLEAVGFYFVFYNEAGADAWRLAVKPLLEKEGVDTSGLADVGTLNEGDGVLVLRLRCPPPGALVAQMITNPYLVVSVPRIDGQVRLCTILCGGER